MYTMYVTQMNRGLSRGPTLHHLKVCRYTLECFIKQKRRKKYFKKYDFCFRKYQVSVSYADIR